MKCNNTFLFDFLDFDYYFLFYQYKSINVGSSVWVIVYLGSRFIAYMKLEHAFSAQRGIWYSHENVVHLLSVLSD